MTKPLAKAVAMLAERVARTPGGALSLAHVCAVVPTAQAGRRLRRALAERFGALVPPLVKTPGEMAVDTSDTSVAGRTDELAAFRDAIREERAAGGLSYATDPAADLERARQLSDMRSILSAGALTFADVAARTDCMPEDESDRWAELASIERRYVDALARRGRRDRVFAMKEFKADFPGVTETLRFDGLEFLQECAGRPESVRTVTLAQIVPCATPADEAARIADYFASVPSDEALPALCVADPELFPEIESAFKARGLAIHDPSRTRLATSSLGRLVTQIVALRRTRSYSVFSAFVRSGDARRWICRELGMSESDMAAVLADLDNRQAEYLPEKVEDVAPKTKGPLRNVFEFVLKELRKRDVRGLLCAIFADLPLDERDSSSREFAAAAEVVNELVDECGDDIELFEMRLDEATYGLEPDDADAIFTDGWMELPFVDADELVIAGFREGCVPESTVGHPFLPDSLRHRLGLPDNAFKELRDREILRIAAGTRDERALRIFYHAIDPKGDVVKPSRLLFETSDDADLAARAKALYGTRAGTEDGSSPDLPEAWRLALPIPPERRKLERISPTRIDSYLRCPFTFYLRDKGVLGDKRMDDRAEELQSWEYGNLAHEALEAFGTSELRDSTTAAELRAFLEGQVDAKLAERFGTSVPAIVAMQGESVKRRLANFAEIQSARRAEGWEIKAVEMKLEIAYAVEGADGAHEVRIYGKCDRIDRNQSTGEWCVIDYKTWDSADKASCFTTDRNGVRTWKSVQLPLYCAMLDACSAGEFADARLDVITSRYCVLGKSKDHVVFAEPMTGGYVPEAEGVVRDALSRIERGLFWPPSRAGEWRFDYDDWLMPSPERSVSKAWIEDQKRRFEELAGK